MSNNQHASEELKDQHETWLGHEMTLRLQDAIRAKKEVWLRQLAKSSPNGDINYIRVLGGRIMGLEDAEALIKGEML